MARDIAEIVIPGLVVAFLFFIIFGFITLMRYFRYKETIALAEKGLLREPRRHKNRNNLRAGLIITAVGLALSCGMAPIGFMVYSPNRLPLGFFGPWMLIGLLPTFVGLALIVIHGIIGNDDYTPISQNDEEQEPIPPHKQP